jgi:hypothetical protein
MTPTSETVRQVFRRKLTLKQETHSPSDAKAATAAVIESYVALARQVARLIGGAGVRVIFARSVHLAQKDFPWLSPVPEGDSIEIPAEYLGSTLEGQRPAVVALAAEAVVVNFADLLAPLIGDHLTVRLFEQAWPDGFRAESTQERSK